MGGVRTPETNPCVKQDLSTEKMDSEVLISMRELSQTLETTGPISISQEEKILTATESLSTSLEITDEPKSQELHKDVLCETAKEADTLGITSEGEKPEIKEFSSCKLIDPSYAQTTTQLVEEDLYDIVKGGEYKDYIEIWFQEVT